MKADDPSVAAPALPAAIVNGAFDNLRFEDFRFLHEASQFGPLTVYVWDDARVRSQTGVAPKFPLSERIYFLKALRFVSKVVPLEAGQDALILAKRSGPSLIWVEREDDGSLAHERADVEQDVHYRVVPKAQLQGSRGIPSTPSPDRKKIIVTGCYDWLHSGHVRFFEEVSGFGDLYVVVGHDANIRLLKGDGHPLLPGYIRRYMVSCIRYVTECLISSGEGWLDADPEIRRLKPDIYAVNQDGDRGGKRQYCQEHGIEYLVLKRTPAPGLPRRSSTELRGF